jgi:hypothetical protein
LIQQLSPAQGALMTARGLVFILLGDFAAVAGFGARGRAIEPDACSNRPPAEVRLVAVHETPSPIARLLALLC